jgi:hypothetical protein
MKTFLLKSLKQIILISFACMIFSCSYGEKIKGNRIVSIEERSEITNFDKIRISAGLTAIISQGDEESVKVEADQNIIKYIITEVKNNGTLSIHWKRKINIRGYKKAVVHICMKSLEAVRASSAGIIKSITSFEVNNLDIDASSAANIDIIVNAENINIDASSAANVKIKGSTENLNADVSSAASIHANKLIAQNVKADASSAGNIDTYAANAIKANASSGGDIDYYGNPSKEKLHTSSGGDIDKK